MSKAFPKHANLVIIGGGITGASAAHFLSEMGWKDIVLIDQGTFPKTGGSSSHAPGGMFQTNGSKFMVEAARYGMKLYESLEWEGEAGAELVGGLELAETDDRVRELHRRCGLGRSFGLEGEVISAAECGKMLPHLDTSKIKAGYYVKDDGVGRATVCVQALLAKAQARGVEVFGDTVVTDITTVEDRLGRKRIQSVQTNQGEITTDKVLCCAGFWGPRIGRMVGQPIPLMPMRHLYAISQDIPELAPFSHEEIKVPLTRAQDHSLYFRQHHGRWSVGYYGHDVAPISADAILSPQEAPIMPSIVDWDGKGFDPGWKAAANLFPSIGQEQNLTYNINGIFSFTPDGQSLLGESLTVKGFWSAEAVWFTHGAGLGKVIAEWMDAGEPQADCHEADINRFLPHVASPHYTRKRGERQYIEVYDILHPKVPSLACRNLRLTPAHARHEALGGYMLEAAGYERPQWYESNQALLKEAKVNIPERDEWSAEHYSPIEAAEAWVTRNKVGLYDVTAFAVLSVEGVGALEYLQALSTNNIDVAYGRMVYTNLLDSRGGIVSDLTIMRQGKHKFLIPTGGAAGPHDYAWLAQHLPEDGSVYLTDVSNQYVIYGLWGPQVWDMVKTVSEGGFKKEEIGFFRFKEGFIGSIPVTVARLSYVGEAGYEIYTSPDYGLALWDLLVEAGATPCGAGGFDSLRMEKGMRGWGSDLTSEYTPLEAGLDFIVKFDHDFKGREALEKQKAEGLKRRLATLVIEDGQVLLGSETVYANEAGWERLGYVTSANYGYTVDQSLAYAYLDTPHDAIGARVWVDYLGTRHCAQVVENVVFDPKSERVRN